MDRFTIETVAGITFNRKQALKFVDGQFIVKEFNEDQPRDERGRFSTVPGGDTLDSSEAQQKIWTKGLTEILGSTAGLGTLDSKETRGQLKATVTRNIAERMSEFDARQLASVALTGPTQIQEVRVALGEIVDTENGQQYFVGLDENGFLNTQTAQYKDFVPAGTPEAEELVRYAAISGMIQQWSLTSNNESSRSLAIQEIAAQTFGIQDHADWEIIREDTTEKMNDLIAEHGDVLRAFVTAQYEATQEYLKSAGVNSIELYRGMAVGQKVFDTIAAEDYGTHEFETRPLTSWSTNNGAALEFASGRNGVLLQATIPAERVFSLPLTGFGCLNEKEVVVLGGTDTVIASTARVARD
jgi:hypothetical protein